MHYIGMSRRHIVSRQYTVSEISARIISTPHFSPIVSLGVCLFYFFFGQVIFGGCENTPYLTWQGEVYNLLQFHIHSPSEHLVRRERNHTD